MRSAAGGYPPRMSDQTYAITHVVGTSKTGTDDAIQNAIATVSKTLRNLDWFVGEEIRGYLGDGEEGTGVKHFQVTLKVGFRYHEE